MLEKSGDPYGTMYNKKMSASDLNIRSAGGAGGGGGGGLFQNPFLLRGQKCAPAIDLSTAN